MYQAWICTNPAWLRTFAWWLDHGHQGNPWQPWSSQTTCTCPKNSMNQWRGYWRNCTKQVSMRMCALSTRWWSSINLARSPGDPSKFMLLDFDWAGPPSAPYARPSPHPFSLSSCPCAAAPPRNPSLAPFSTLIFKYSWAVLGCATGRWGCYQIS